MAPHKSPATTSRRARGRPVGGGNTSEQAKAVLMDAAERSILMRGFQASTMEVIAREADYSRAAMYRHFPGRRHLLAALVQRTTGRYRVDIGKRLQPGAGLAEILLESLVIVATELIHDPLLQILSEQTDEGTVAHLIAGDTQLSTLVEQLVEAMAGDADQALRAGLSVSDAGRFIITTAMTLLMGVIPEIEDPATARRYLQTFILPAILANPPAPHRVFK